MLPQRRWPFTTLTTESPDLAQAENITTMGTLRRFDLNHFAAECFVETGTFLGDSLAYAQSHPYKMLHSVELFPEFVEQCQRTFANDKRVHLWCGKSIDLLPDILKQIEPYGSALFWLDAHLPSNMNNIRLPDEVEFPLEAELRVIQANRDTRNDNFLIDDLRIYEEGRFANGNWPKRSLFADVEQVKNGISFIDALFSGTHTIRKLFDHEGYVVLRPR